MGRYSWFEVLSDLLAMIFRFAPCSCLVFWTIAIDTTLQADAAPLIEFQQGDTIAVVGNGLADRIQHDGWLETYLQARFPEHELVVRHLGFTGDELTLRMRSSGFGSPEDWLQRTKANIVFAFFGYNESFRGEQGLGKFKNDLAKFVKDTRLPAKTAAKIARRVVLFSPIAYEDMGDPLLPSPGPVNERLAAYTKAMSEVAGELDVPFVDLFHASQETYDQSLIPLTINGIHLNETGNHEIAKIVDAAFGNASAVDGATLSKIREAVLDKNFHWFQRYRTTDGYSIFGGRKGTGGSRWTPKNEPVMKREMEILDVMTANRDQKIWATAQGKQHNVDDYNTPPLIPVASNKPGPLEDGSYPFLDAEEAIKKMTVAEGMAVNLFASEEQFPELQNPVQSAVDTKGRLWVAAWPSYPHWNPKDELNDKLLIFEDNDGDGRADKCKVFADGLHNPTGFEFYNGGVYVAQIPDIWFLQDTDGDDVADVRERVLGGIDSADTHHSINSFVIGPGGGLYFQEGLFHRTQVETPHRAPVRVADAGVFRYDPKSQEFFAHASYRFANPHGHVFTYWGDDIVHDGTSATPYFGPAISGKTSYPNKHRGGPTIYDKRTRPCPATAIISSQHFPEQIRDSLLVCNVIGEQGILQYELHENGAGLKGIETGPFLMSTDPNFRPVDLEVGDDGAVYVLDWQNPLIGHLQHNLRDSNRDHLHGRIYRVSCPDRALIEGVEIADQPLDQLFALLTERDNSVRYRAKIELSSRPTDEVIAACKRWVDTLQLDDPQIEHHFLEALWVHQHHHVVNEPLLDQLLGSGDYRVRAAATTVLRAWREQIDDAQQRLERLVHDENPRVRLGAVLICSDLNSAAAAELALETARYPRDKFLDYTLMEAVRTLKPLWTQALAADDEFCRDNLAAIPYLIRASKPQDLLKFSQHEAVLEGLITFTDVDAGVRFGALQSLAKKRNLTALDQLLDLLSSNSNQAKGTHRKLIDLLEEFQPGDLQAIESRFLQLATESDSAPVRQGALAALVRIDGAVDRAWSLAGGTGRGLVDLLSCVERVPEEALRASFYGRVRPVMLDPSAAADSGNNKWQAQIDRRSIEAMAHIPGHEAEKLDDLIGFLEANRSRAQVVATIESIPEESRTPMQAARVVATTSKYLATVDASNRASGDAYDEMQLALKFAELLPADERSDAMATLSGFVVQVLRLSTIPHRMSYDQEKMVVQAGSPVQLVFNNPDNMPHNFVLTEPGYLAEIGMRAESNATDPGMIAREYVPNDRRIVLSSKLLQPQQQQVIDFVAPKNLGVYPYVCTYPGHWRRMFGALYVVDSVEEIQADPQAYLAAHSIEEKDRMLKFNRPLHKWTFAELEPALDRLGSSHSFDRGAKLFQVASCAACHSVQEGQRRFAPDLTKLDPKRKPADVLRSMVEPSKEIEDKYRTSQFLLDTGKAVVGLVVEETDKDLTLMIDPLASCEPVIVGKDEIEERYKSELSLMPSGLLDRLTEEEILELCAFVVARGDKNAPVYRDDVR